MAQNKQENIMRPETTKEMNIKFEWVRSAFDKKVHHCWVGGICCGFAQRWGEYDYMASAGDNQGGMCLAQMKHEIASLDEAKAWVEQQALLWLASATNPSMAE